MENFLVRKSFPLKTKENFLSLKCFPLKLMEYFRVENYLIWSWFLRPYIARITLIFCPFHIPAENLSIGCNVRCFVIH